MEGSVDLADDFSDEIEDEFIREIPEIPNLTTDDIAPVLDEISRDVEMRDEMEISSDILSPQEVSQLKADMKTAILNQCNTSFQRAFTLFLAAMEKTFTNIIPMRLKAWKDHQKTIGLKVQEDGINYKDAEKIFSFLNSYLNSFVDGIITIESMFPNRTDPLHTTLHASTSKMIEASFIVVDQPPQICMKIRTFNVSLQLLMSKAIKNSESLTVSILNEQDARDYRNNLLSHQNNSDSHIFFQTHFKIAGGMTLSTSGSGIVYKIKGMKYNKKINKSDTPVAETKYYLLFSASVVMYNGIKINISTMSLPIVCITNNSQEADAYRRIFWNNLLSEEDNVVVEWTKIGEALKMFFHCISRGCQLNDGHLTYLRSKVFGNNSDNNNTRTFKQFSEKNLTQRSAGKKGTFYSAWDYLYEAAKLTRGFSEHWKNGYIHGFIERSKAEEMISKCDPGTFLIRFTDSYVGKITIARCIYTEEGQKKCKMGLPSGNFDPDFDTVLMKDAELECVLDANGVVHKKGSVFRVTRSLCDEY